MTKTTLNILSFLLISMIAGFVISGCSSSHVDSISPSNPAQILNDPYTDLNIPDIVSFEESSRSLVSSGRIEFDSNRNISDISIDRNLSSHLRVDTLLPPPSIRVNSYDSLTGIIDVDVTITNPFPVDGFDLRLIIFTDDNGVKLINADDWTSLWDIPSGAPINPFKSYAKSIPMRRFGGQTQSTERLLIYLPNLASTVSFAIDVSYPENCAEPYSIEKFTQGQIYNRQDSETIISVDVLDHQNDIQLVSLYCPAITGLSIVDMAHSQNNTWTLNLVNNTGASEGDYSGFILAASSNAWLYDNVKIRVSPSSACIADMNDSLQTAESLKLVDSVTGCVDTIDEDWYVIYAPPMGIENGTIDLSIQSSGTIGMTVWASMPGEPAPGTLVTEDYHAEFGADPRCRYFVNVIGLDGRVTYELSVNMAFKMANVDLAIFVPTTDGTWEGTWPVFEEPDPDEELTPAHIQNLVNWTNNIWNQYGYNLVWDQQITIMDAKYYIADEDGEDGEMHNLYGRGSNKICMYFNQSTGTAYCYVYGWQPDHNVNNVFSVYGPNCWYWESVGAHEWGHGLGYLFDEYVYGSTGCPCGDNACIGYEPWLYWCDDGCYDGNIMWYCIIGWPWDWYSYTKGQAQFVNKFHFNNPGNFPWY
jgi:hypothetical protein